MRVDIYKTLQVHDTSGFIPEFVAHELTVINPKYTEAEKAGRYTRGINKYIKSFSVDASGIYHLPRGYKDRLFAIATQEGIPIEFTDYRNVAYADPPFEHNIKLRPYQSNALGELSQHEEGLLVGPAGCGKTVMGLGITVMSRQKALWITHTNHLADQFIDRANSFITNLNEDDLGEIRDGTWRIGDRLTVGLIQTLVKSEEKLYEIANDFGIIVVDEAHHVPATTFTAVVNKLNSFYLYGLTATPKRRDGLEGVMCNTLGPVRHVITREEVAAGKSIITPKVKVVELSPDLTLAGTYQEILKALTFNDYRNNIIVNDVLTESAAGNVCIVVTERVAHAEILYKMLLKAGAKVGLAVGKITNKKRLEVMAALSKGEITDLVCTSHLLGEGFDHPPLNRLFFGLPIRNQARVEQLVGRVQRPSPGKEDAIIYDYVDITHGLCRNQFKSFHVHGSRYTVYKRLGCTIL